MPREVEMTPAQMKDWRDLSSLTLKTLSKRTGVSVSQLCAYELSSLPLRADQLSRIERELKSEIRERQKRIMGVIGARDDRVAAGA